MHVVGQLYISNNYICFSSKEEDLCQLIIPLREVRGRVDTPLPGGLKPNFYPWCLGHSGVGGGEG